MSVDKFFSKGNYANLEITLSHIYNDIITQHSARKIHYNECFIQDQLLDLARILQNFQRNEPAFDEISGFKRSAFLAESFMNASPINAKIKILCLEDTQHPFDTGDGVLTNCLFAFMLIKHYLYNAVIERPDKSLVTLDTPIHLSMHSFMDFSNILTNAAATLADKHASESEKQYCFNTLSFIIEQITYKSNMQASYKPDL